MRPGPRARNATLAVVVLLCGLTLLAAFFNKARCSGAPFDGDGRSVVFDELKDRDVCYSDIQFLWLGRDIDNHVFPYIDGAITDGGALVGGAVEYPVLSGTLMWIGALGAHNDAEFLLHSALLLAPFALLIAWMLGRLAGRAAMLWSIGPPLILYAFHNWELPVVAASVAAVFVVASWNRVSLRQRATAAAVLLGVGFCLKLYPGLFVLPLMAYVLTGGIGGREFPADFRRRYDVRGAIGVGLAAAATAIAINLPFALAGFQGWRASFEFQQQREADITTNSIWFWGVRHLFGTSGAAEASFQHAVSVLSPVMVLGSFALALWLGWRRYGVDGTYPWVAVSGSMLCGFLLFHKVHSPQYTLWLIPFFVLLTVPWGTVLWYLVADLAVGIGVFQYFWALQTAGAVEWTENIVQFGVWGRAALLVYFFFMFLRAKPRGALEPEPVEPPERELVGSVR